MDGAARHPVEQLMVDRALDLDVLRDVDRRLGRQLLRVPDALLGGRKGNVLGGHQAALSGSQGVRITPGIGTGKAPGCRNSKRMTTELTGFPRPLSPRVPSGYAIGPRDPGVNALCSRQYGAPPLSVLDRTRPRPTFYSGVAGSQSTSLSHGSQSPQKQNLARPIANRSDKTAAGRAYAAGPDAHPMTKVGNRIRSVRLRRVNCGSPTWAGTRAPRPPRPAPPDAAAAPPRSRPAPSAPRRS